MIDVVLATNNAGKVTEFQQLLKGLSWHVVPQSHFNLPSVAETGLTFIENAIIKARYAAEKTGLPALADDSGLVVDALHGAPGIYSARYAGENASAEQHYMKVLQELGRIPAEKRTARFHCSLVYVAYANDPTPIIAEGFWEGSILFEPTGKYGFGYDPIFYVPNHHCSAAEIPTEIKNNMSHRGRAFPKLLQALKEQQVLQ